MTASTLSQPLLMAGSALLASLGRAGQWTLARYMRAPLASTGLLAMVTMTALAGSNALYFQRVEHPSPFFAPPRAEVAALPTPALDRPDASQLPPIATPQAEPARVASQETTGSVPAPAPVVVPDAPVGNAQMFAVQKKLFEVNLFSGTIDGYYGPKTAEAIRAFEQRNGMTPTGSMSEGVVKAILGSDASGRVSQPVSQAQPQPQQAATPAPAAEPVTVRAAVIAPAQQQDEIVAVLPPVSPAERAFDDVAQTAASTIDNIIAAVDGSRGTTSTAPANPPLPQRDVAAAAPVQPMPAPVVETAAAPAPAPAPVEALRPPQQATASAATASTPRTPPANDTQLVTQIQRGLASLGFFRGQIDGKPGTETARAIREFENFYRYRMTGQVQPDLVDLLVKAGATI